MTKSRAKAVSVKVRRFKNGSLRVTTKTGSKTKVFYNVRGKKK